jgi:hypothetical protein
MNISEFLPEEYRHDLQIINETTAQIIRDFQNDDLKIIYSGDNTKAFDELKQQLIPFVRTLMKNSTALHALLYRVDISEKEFSNAMNDSNKSKDEIIAELIIRREFKKVLTRKFFSK